MVRYLTIVVAIGAVCGLVAAVELYSDKHDGIDVHGILASDQLREEYYNCFMDTGPCVTEAAVFFKGNFAESIVTQCAKCTERQKQMFDIIVDWYMVNQEDKWNALVAKFVEEAKKMNIAPA